MGKVLVPVGPPYRWPYHSTYCSIIHRIGNLWYPNYIITYQLTNQEPESHRIFDLIPGLLIWLRWIIDDHWSFSYLQEIRDLDCFCCTAMTWGVFVNFSRTLLHFSYAQTLRWHSEKASILWTKHPEAFNINVMIRLRHIQFCMFMAYFKNLIEIAHQDQKHRKIAVDVLWVVNKHVCIQPLYA